MKYILTLLIIPLAYFISRAQVTTYPYSESFESGFGLWTQSTTDNMNWTRKSGNTTSSSTGPSDAVNGSYYLYTEATGNSNKTAILESPVFSYPIASSIDISFRYHMYGSNMGSLALEVSIDNGLSWLELYYQSGDQGNSWGTVSIDIVQELCLDVLSSDMQLRFKGTTGSGFRSDMAIDYFRIENVTYGSPPVPSSFPESQDFELAGSLGVEWKNPDGTGWQRTSSPSTSGTTGPGSAASGNYYLYFDAQSFGASSQDLLSPKYYFEPGDLAVFGFKYHMYGSNVQSLTVNVVDACGNTSQVWTKSGDQGNVWQSAVLDLTTFVNTSGESPLQLEFVASASSGDGNIALDFFEISDLGYVDSEVTNPGGGGGGGPSPWDVQTDDGVYLSSGKVAINTDTISTDHELLVNGTISAEEVRVEVYNVPDYVFEEHYELNTLSEIEKYIDLNGHLPEVLPARVLEETGINTGEFNMLLLRKIEELTLHLIRQEKEMVKLQSELKGIENSQLDSKINPNDND